MNFTFTLFDYAGVVIVETASAVYTYRLDGAVVREIEKVARHRPGRAINMLKQLAVLTKEDKMEKANTYAATVVTRQQKIAAIEAEMQKKGGFKVFKQGSSIRVIDAVCGCPNHRCTGLIFYKRFKPRGKEHRIIVHVICFNCGTRWPMIVIDQHDYDEQHPKFNGNHFFLRSHGLRGWMFK